jgi:CBS domain-containing protein
MLTYKAIDIYSSEEVRWRNQPLAEAVVDFIRGLKIAARCLVTRGAEGCDESGQVVTNRLEVLSFNMPLHVRIILPASELERVLPRLGEMVSEGIVAVHDLSVVSHRVRNAFFPRQLKVRDVMTREPKKIAVTADLGEAAELLLSSIFTGLPVVDDRGRPVGVVSQGDLVIRGGMPLRLGLLAVSDAAGREAVLSRLATRTVAEVMTAPAVVIAEDQPLTQAVELMLSKGVKRLPVVDPDGKLSGILSRLDLFKTVMLQSPDWDSFKAQSIEVDQLRRVSDIARRDVHTVLPETSIADVIQVIDCNDIQRVAVVDAAGTLLGMISDSDVLRYLKPRQPGIWGVFEKARHPFGAPEGDTALHQSLSHIRAADVMTTQLVTVKEEMLIGQAMALIVAKGLKRLPVVDDEGRFKGMISRDALLRTGFQAAT